MNFLFKPTNVAPLAFFRIVFGAVMTYSLFRFFQRGWIEQFYLEPKFHFTYFGFDWVKPLGDWTYILFAFCFLCTLFISIGFLYRLASLGFFLSFTYLEFIEKTNYLNHYYFISLVAFLMIFLPANAYFSLDAYKNQKIRSSTVPKWTILCIQLMLGILYFYAGLAKLNSDWLIEAQPLKIWLSNRTHFPILGPLFDEHWFHLLFSWMGAAFDLSIAFFLFYKKTTKFAYLFVVFFHLMTSFLFPIGMFPYIMMGCTLIFFDASFYQKILQALSNFLKLKSINYPNKVYTKKAFPYFLILFFSFQFLFPFRYLLYPGELFWHEQGFNFSWRVMLMEKTGYTQFTILDKTNGRKFLVDNAEYLTRYQETQMSTRPELILQYAHYLASVYKEKFNLDNPAVYVDCQVSLNGRKRQKLIDEKANLLEFSDDFQNKTYILPFADKIYGL